MGLVSTAPGPKPRLFAPDAARAICWRFNDANLATVANLGQLGSSYSLAAPTSPTLSATAVAGVDGILDTSTFFLGATNGCFKGQAGYQPAAPVTISAWVRPTAMAGGSYANIVGKAYRGDNSWSLPNITFGLALTSAGDGSWFGGFSTGADGTASAGTSFTVTSEPFKVRLNQWQHLAVSYDGAIIKGYYNGILAGSVACTGAIDYNTASPGPWTVGNFATTGTNQPYVGFINEVAIDAVLRAPSELRNFYLRGVGRPTI